MKKLFLMVTMVMVSIVAMAQTNQLVWANGSFIYGTPVESIDSLTFGEMEEVDTLHLLLPRTLIKVVHDTIYIHDTVYVEVPGNQGNPDTPAETHEYVDLGLSVKWATCNVGANTPEEYGDYFAWGEVEPKEYYDWSTYKYGTGYYEMTKYCSLGSFGKDGFSDSKTVLDPEDDAATVNWGGSWRMPTYEEFVELRNNCTWTCTTQNGVKGYKVTGSNGNSIFFPAAARLYGGPLYDEGSCGYYWSSSLDTVYPYGAGYESFNSGVRGLGPNVSTRCYGQSVRPVCE